ncbi:hypothetical protein PMAYCL1PPCAC_03994, partial [Pristionchus mayeri]
TTLTNSLTSTSTTSASTSTSTSTSTAVLVTSYGVFRPGLPLWAIILIVVGVLIICVCFVGTVVLARRRIQALRAEVIEKDKEKAIRSGLGNSRYYDLPGRRTEWEVERKFVSIDFTHKLGEGAFGSVLLENADAQAEFNFRSEIDLMKMIGYHERIVNMLACVTLSDPILLICEYCINGDLLNFMRKRRKFMFEHPEETDETKIITVQKQLMFAIQIAYGLEYLSSQGFIHRDIAARNIMVDHQESCKIGDFGLARLLGEENQTYQAKGGKLPLMWMPPEAIDKCAFSTASDVWSFGVLLFEIVTLGGSPYAEWPATELLDRLKRGERMERPDNCSEMLYEVMRNCWSEMPSNRPNFTELRKELGSLLEDINEDTTYYLKLNDQAHYYILDSSS